MTGAEFVRQVMDRVGAASPSELAETMQWRRGTERTVSKWLTGETRPSFGYVMEMVERAGLFSIDGVVPQDGAALRDPLRSLEAKVDRMARRTGDALGSLEATVKELSARIPPSDDQSQETG